jgi:hypothetical protein
VTAFRRSRPCLPLGGHVPCPSFDDHVMLAFTVPVLAFVFRRLRSHPRSGHAVVRSCERPSALASVFTSDCPLAKRIGRAHLLVLDRARLSAHDPHSIGSQSTGSRVRVTFRRRWLRSSFDREPPLHVAPVNRAHARLATIINALPYELPVERSRLATRSSNKSSIVLSRNLRLFWAETSADPEA